MLLTPLLPLTSSLPTLNLDLEFMNLVTILDQLAHLLLNLGQSWNEWRVCNRRGEVKDRQGRRREDDTNATRAWQMRERERGSTEEYRMRR